MEDTERIQQLIQKYLNKSCTAKELEELDILLKNNSVEEFDPTLEAIWNRVREQSVQYPVNWDEMYESVISGTAVREGGRAKIKSIGRRWWMAASVIVLIGLAAYFQFFLSTGNRSSENNTTIAGLNENSDIQPGKEGALLILADGTELLLDTVKSGSGVLANEGHSAVYVKEGTLVYTALSPVAAAANIDLYNTMTTPHGRQFSLQLSDGTKVWLNAGSSIRFPVVFDKSERRVEITGEAYFEVAERKTQPFIVKTKNQTVEVLGTWFNINAYDNEDAEKTTLLKGSVRVEANSGKTEADVVLKPGQQAVLAHQFPAVVHHPQVIGNSSGIKVQNIADLKKVVAWKDGLFDFSNASLEEVMRQLARWYDINVKFEGDVPDIEFAGRVGRDVSLSRMLVFFKESGVNFRMENGNTLIIGKK